MMSHTKDKGDVAVALVLADLMKNHNSQICLPISEHLPFDLIGVTEDNKVFKIQVKHRCAYKDKVVSINLRHSYPDKVGHVVKYDDISSVDVYAIYSPDIEHIMYVSSSYIISQGVKTSLSLRIGNKNEDITNAKNSNWCDDFKKFPPDS